MDNDTSIYRELEIPLTDKKVVFIKIPKEITTSDIKIIKHFIEGIELSIDKSKE